MKHTKRLHEDTLCWLAKKVIERWRQRDSEEKAREFALLYCVCVVCVCACRHLLHSAVMAPSRTQAQLLISWPSLQHARSKKTPKPFRSLSQCVSASLTHHMCSYQVQIWHDVHTPSCTACVHMMLHVNSVTTCGITCAPAWYYAVGMIWMASMSYFNYTL